MLVLLKYNNLYEKNVVEVKKLGYVPITLFELQLDDKEQIRKDLNTIFDKIENLKPQYSAIGLYLKKIDNSTSSLINNLKKDFDIIIGYGGMNKINRYFIEQTNIDFLLDPHNSSYYNKIDFIHHFNSGLNHVLLNVAKEKQIKLFFSLNFIYNSKKNIPKEIGRISQNIKFARKYNIPVHINYIISSPNQLLSLHDLKKTLSIFGMSSKQIVDSTNLLKTTIDNNRFKNSKLYINKDICFKN